MLRRLFVLPWLFLPAWAAVPPPPGDGLPEYMLNGVVPERVRPGTTTLNGKEVPPAEALRVIASAGVPDDADRLRLTVIGTAAQRGPVLKDLETHPELVALRDRLAVQDYAPDEWELQCGFYTGGAPTIYCQAPSGQVLWRADSYAGPVLLAAAIRKADPRYDPKDDRDPFKKPLAPEPAPTPAPAPAPAVEPGRVVAPAVVLAALIALYLVRRRS